MKLGITVAALAFASSISCAQNYPLRPVRVIVPNAPAGLADIMTRTVMVRLSENLGQQFIVDNRPGAGGTIATATAAAATADGYTLLSVFDSHITNPHLYKNLGYDVLKDFVPVSMLVRGPLVLTTRRGHEVKSIPEFIRLAKAKPGSINFAVVGPGSPSRLLVELLEASTGIRVTQIPYKGAGLALTELMGGQVDAMFPTVPSVIGHYRSGRLPIIAVTSTARSPILPGVPTISETVHGFFAESWVGVLAPARTPAPIIAHLQREIAKVLTQPDITQRIAEQGYEALGSKAGAFDQWLRSEHARWGKLIRERDIRIE